MQVHTVEGGDHGLNVKGGKAATAAARDKFIHAAVQFAQRIAGSSQDTAAAVDQDEQPTAPPKKRARKKA